MKCVFCDKDAEYLYKGASLCKEHKDKQFKPQGIKEIFEGYNV